MTTTATEASTTAAAEAAEAAEAAADAAADAAQTAATEADTDDETPAADTAGDTVVVVTDEGGDPEGAQDDATNLDHEQRITRVEERLAAVETTAAEAALRADVAEMIAGHSHDDVIEQAEAVAAATVEAAAEADETGEPASVVVPEPPGADGIADVVTVQPDVPPANEKQRPGLFRW